MTTQVPSNVKFEWMKTEAQLARLKSFAESFEHTIPTTKHPICMMKRDGKDFAYNQIFMGPLVFSAWHTDPNICHPRDVVEGMKNLVGWAKIQHGGGFVAVPTDTKSFIPPVMQKLGLIRSGMELYEIWAD